MEIYQFIWYYIQNVQSNLRGSRRWAFLFNISIYTVFLNPLPCRVLIFADDAKLFARISSTNYCYVLQASLDGVIIWCKIVSLTLNEDKCKVISFYGSRTFIDYNYTINGIPLSWVQETKDFGFIYILTLSFRTHIDFISCKTLKILGFIHRHSTEFNSAPCLVALYCSLVR